MRTYHACGYAISVETQATERSHITLYRDDDEESDTYGEAVIHCPGCDAGLSDESLHAEQQE